MVQRSATGVAPKPAAAVMRELTAGLERAGFVVCVTSCKGATVSVTLSPGRRDLTVDLEAVDAGGKQLAVRTFGVPLSGAPFPVDVAGFFAALKVESDAPKVVALEPVVEVEAKPVIVDRAPSPVLPVLAVTTAVTAAAAIGLVIASLVVKGQVESRVQPGRAIEGTRAEAQSQANLANGLGTASAVTFGLAGAALVTTGVLWFQRQD